VSKTNGSDPGRSDDDAPERTVSVAVACDESGRLVYVSLDDLWYRRVDHFPNARSEAVALYHHAMGPRVLLDDLTARFKKDLVVLGTMGARPKVTGSSSVAIGGTGSGND
jgi:hypothetical protein